jgi:hypothetical protein
MNGTVARLWMVIMLATMLDFLDFDENNEVFYLLKQN